MRTKLLTRASRWLRSKSAAADGQTVRLLRDGRECEFSASRGRTVSEDYGENGAAINTRLFDWVEVDPADLVIDGVQFKPKSGDVIIDADGTRYECVHQTGEDAWRWMDHTKEAIRIHTIERGGVGDD